MEPIILSWKEATKIFSNTISNLKETTINPCGARLLTREISDYIKKWLPEIKPVKTKEAAKNRNSQDFLFRNLFITSALLLSSVFGMVSNDELILDTSELLNSICLYAQNALNQISFKAFFKTLSITYEIGDENKMKAQLEKEAWPIRELNLLATLENDKIALTSLELDLKESLNDSEFLLACTKKSNIFRKEVTARISQIVQKLKEMDRTGQPIKGKDLDALAVFSIHFLTSFACALTCPAFREPLILNGTGEDIVSVDFLSDLYECADLLKKYRL